MTVSNFLNSKREIVSSFRTHDSDTGSYQVQIALVTSRIQYLTDHMKLHSKDLSARRSLLILVAKRAKLLKYLKLHNSPAYEEITQKLSIKKK
jgi:small subunit ribosomal protein S15